MLSRLDVFFDWDAAWIAFLVGSEMSKALLCFVIAWTTPWKRYAYAGSAWFVGQACIELFSKVGADDGYSAHGTWEWYALAILFTVIHFTNDRQGKG